MADNILDSFFVSLGFRIDESGARRFAASTERAGQQTEIVNKRIKELEEALKKVGDRFTQSAAEPARKFSEFGYKIGQTTNAVVRSLGEAGRTAGVLAGAMTAAFSKVADSASEVGRTARQIGTTTEDLNKVRYAADRAGIGADKVTGVLENIQRRIRETGGATAGIIRDWTGLDWERLKNKASEGLVPLSEYLLDIYNNAQKGGPALAYQMGELIGVNRDFIDSLAASKDQWREGLKAADAYYAGAAKHQEDITAKAERFRSNMRDVFERVGGIAKNAFAAAEPVFDSAFKAIKSGLDTIIESEQERPGLGLVSAAALGLTGLQTIVPALKQIGVNVNLLNPWMLALSGAALLIMTNWDKLGPYFEAKFKQIKAAYDEGGLEAAIGQTIEIAKDIFKDAASWLTPRLQDIATTLKSWNWSQTGRDIGEYIANGIKALFADEEQGASLARSLIEAFGDVGRAAARLGTQLIAGVIQGIWEGLGGQALAEKILGLGKSRTKFAPGPEGEQEWLSQYSPQRQAAIEQYAQPAEGNYQGGGIVSANLHEGEMVLPANISRGLQRMIRSMDAPAFAGGGGIGSRADEKLEDWLRGYGVVPKVSIDNFDEAGPSFWQQLTTGATAAGAAISTGASRVGSAIRGMFGGGGPGVSGAAGGPLPGEGTPGDPRGMLPVIRAAASAHGIDPDTAVRVARSEGLAEFQSTARAPGGGRETSWGAFQLYTGGGLGNEFQKETGLDPSDPKNEVATIWYAMKKAREKGWGPWAGARKQGITGMQGIGGGVEQLQGQVAGIRKQPISPQLLAQLTSAAEQTGVRVQVTSGGQSRIGTGGPRTGSTRHDLGGAADVKLLDASGRALDMRNPEDAAKMAQFTEASVAAGATGVGAGLGYMGPQMIHIGGGRAAHWGGAPWIGGARARGEAARMQGTVLDRMQDAHIGGEMAGDTINNNGGNRNVEMNVTHNVNVYGGGESDTVGRFVGESRRVIQDMQRDMQGAIA